MKPEILSFDELAAIEPRLRELYEEIRAVRDDGTGPYFCANSPWYGYEDWSENGFRARLSRLVGWNAGTEPRPPAPLGIAETGEPVIYTTRDLVAKWLEEGPPPQVDPRLLTCEAYDTAYKTLYELLPDCRGDCPCVVILRVV